MIALDASATLGELLGDGDWHRRVQRTGAPTVREVVHLLVTDAGVTLVLAP